MMKLKPTFISFALRYFVFTYFLLWALFSIWLEGQISYVWYVSLWIFMTMLPALILSFKRVRIGWFFWIGLLDVVAFAPKFKVIYEKLLSISSNPIYHDVIVALRSSSEIKIYIIVSLTGIIFTQLYRLSFSYTIDENLKIVEIKGGIFSRKDRKIPTKHITDVSVSRSFLQRIFGIGTVVPITSSSMGMGTKNVFGGGAVSKGGVGAFVGGATGENIANIENPVTVIYGVKNPEKVANKIIELIAKN